MLATLMFFTIAAAAAVGIGQFLWFLSSRRNREVASEALVGSPNGRSQPVTGDGALPEILGVTGVAMLAMALLMYGYNAKGYVSARNVQPPAEKSSTSTSPGSGSAAVPQTQPTLPRSNPADMPNPPTTFPGASGNPVDPTQNNSPNPAYPEPR